MADHLTATTKYIAPGKRRQEAGGFLRRASKYRLYYLLAVPGIVYFVIFKYLPMIGIIIAFKDFSPFGGLKGIIAGPWVGLKHFITFFNSYYFWSILGNTLIISFLKLITGFPAAIVLALLINEVAHTWYKRLVQTISYLPHFLSWVIVTGLTINMLSPEGGVVNQIIRAFGGKPILFLGNPHYFRGVLVIFDLWKSVGWSTIIILATIATVNPEMYESAIVDGANRFQQVRYITLPSISTVVVILLILRIGHIMEAGFEQILLLYNPSVYQVADIIDTYVYRMGLDQLKFAFAAAVGLFKAVIALVLVVAANTAAKKFEQEGIW